MINRNPYDDNTKSVDNNQLIFGPHARRHRSPRQEKGKRRPSTQTVTERPVRDPRTDGIWQKLQ